MVQWLSLNCHVHVLVHVLVPALVHVLAGSTEEPSSIPVKSIPFYCVHNRHINKKVMEFVQGKPKGTNPAIMALMGNPIDMCAVNGSKKQSILLLEKPNLN